MAISNADLAQKISDLIDFWSTLTVEYKNWLGGSVGGGPNSDGQYPLTDFTGNETLVESPAKLSDLVGGFVDQAETAETNAAASAVAAQSSEDDATTEAGIATTARIDAESARTTAINEATAALNSSVNATASQAAALVSKDAALVSELAAAVSAAAALVSELAAADSATEAATFEPTNFYLRTALDGGQLDNRYYTETESDANFEPLDTDIVKADVDEIITNAWVWSRPAGDSAIYLKSTSAGDINAPSLRWQDSNAVNLAAIRALASGGVAQLALGTGWFNAKLILKASGAHTMTGAFTIAGALIATSYDGVLAANLVDKNAVETIPAVWQFAGLIDFQNASGIQSTTGWLHLQRNLTNSKVAIGFSGTDVDLVVPNGDISGATIGGITEANLLDKAAIETITKLWKFTAESDSLVNIRLQRFSATGRAQFTLNDQTGADLWRCGLTGAGGTDFAFYDGTGNRLTLQRAGGVVAVGNLSSTSAVWSEGNSPDPTVNAPVLRMAISGGDGYLDCRNFNAGTWETLNFRASSFIFTSGPIVAGTVAADFAALTATSYDGVLAANLLDKAAAETIAGAYTYTAFIEIVKSSEHIRLTTTSSGEAWNYIAFYNNAAVRYAFIGMNPSGNFEFNLEAGGFFQFKDAVTIEADLTFSKPDAATTIRFDSTDNTRDVDFQYRIGGTLTALIRWNAGNNTFTWMDRDPSTVNAMVLDLEDQSLAVVGAVTGSNLNVSDWDTAFGWGNHASPGYHVQTVFSLNADLVGRSTTAPDTVGDSAGVTASYLSSNGPAGTDHSLITLAYSSAWQTQIAADWREKGRLFIRGQLNTVWSSWQQVWSSDDFDAANLVDKTSAETIVGAWNIGANFIYTRISALANLSKDKLRVWTNNIYTIGMINGLSYGGLVNDYAMTFQFNDSATRGFWWGHSGHTTAQGAMVLTTGGKLTVGHSIRVGYGEGDTTVPGATYDLDVSGSIGVSGKGVPYHVSTGYVGGKISVQSTAPGSPTKGDLWFDDS